ncbi:MAG: M23 family metallopeptidase [Bacteroidota bacterium]
MPASPDQTHLLTTIARYGTLAVGIVVAVAMLRGTVEVTTTEPSTPSKTEAPRPVQTTQGVDDADAPQAQRVTSDPLVEVGPRSVLARLRMPVEGVTPDELYDSFTDPRSGGRTHHALDIMAPRGTPIRAAAAGTLARIHTSARGGKSLYQIGPDSAYVFYYAHLDTFATGLEEGQTIRKGDVLGTVGSTGNARAAHLHFGIWTYEDGRVWGGTPVNPYLWLAE